jgi:type IV secretion system protein VirB2
MANLHLPRWLKKYLVGLAMATWMASNTDASTTGNLPFNSTMNTLEQAISGPFLLSAAVIMVVVTCLMLAFAEWGDGFKKLINIVMWLSIAFAATSFITTMFGTGAVF